MEGGIDARMDGGIEDAYGLRKDGRIKGRLIYKQ